jgi:hypothetical protein
MKEQVDYRIEATIKNELPKIIIEISYKDDFSDDHYVLEGLEGKVSDTKNIPFSFVKNGEEIGTVVMLNRNADKLLSDAMVLVDDFDFKNEFSSKTLSSISGELSDFFEHFDKSIIANGFTIEGELKRMKKLSGMTR